MSESARPKHTNRLADETSPYLLQHAHNPVDWYPWGPEAFERARREGRPIFLSVGYSTCYWCHVMERQSFENEQVAEEMNRRFINIKVDREERPDVDQLYMTAVQVMTRHGGWPMSVFLTPDLKPFYGGTYYPPTDQHGRPGFLTILRGIDDAWHNRRDEVNKAADQLVNILRQLAEPPPPQQDIHVDFVLIDELIERSVADYEPQHGGFGGAPKFPRQTLLELLLTFLLTPSNDPSARLDQQTAARKGRIAKMLRRTLDAMADGGIRDHLGGAFHRYSTDARWLVPHFEIMLYDNAMLAWVYTEAYRQLESRRYAKVARGILDFVLGAMTSPDGAFYTAFDAEVDAQEGKSYLWTKEEVEQVLRDSSQISDFKSEISDIELFTRVYGLDLGPNFADPHHGNGQPDRNILYLPKSLSTVAAEINITEEELDQRLEPMRQTLYAARCNRKQPLLDTKIITSWNALMIRAFAYAGEILQEQRYLDAAAKAADYLLRRHRLPDGRLIRTSGGGAKREETVRVRGTEEYVATRREGDRAHDVGTPDPPDAEAVVGETEIRVAPDPAAGAIPAFIDDYAFLMQALLALRRASGRDLWQEHAAELAVVLRDRFADDIAAFFFTDREAGDIIVRQKIGSDSPLPSGNAAAAMAAIELDRPENARGIIETFAQQMHNQGEAMSAMVQATLLYLRRYEPCTVRAGAASEADRPLPPEQVAQGVVSIRAAWRTPELLNVHLNILKGFHLNAHQAGEGLVGTQLAIAGEAAELIDSIDYPPGEQLNVAFADKPIRVYSGETIIAVRFKQRMIDQPPLRVTLSYQACDEGSCLPPVTKQVDVETP